MYRASGVPVREFSIYLHLKGKRPKKVAVTETNTPPSTWEHDGHTYYFTNVDLTRNTITYSDIRPQPVAKER